MGIPLLFLAGPLADLINLVIDALGAALGFFGLS